MPALFSNSATATLASAITSTATSISVTGGFGSIFPILSGSNYFYATLVDSSNNIEVVKVTARVTDVMTVVRGQEGTTARAYPAGSKFELRVTAAGLTNMAQLDAANSFTGNNTFAGTSTFNGAATFSSSATFSGTVNFSGAATFATTITGSVSGNAGTVTNGVYTTGDQTIAGNKTFSGATTFSNGRAKTSNATSAMWEMQIPTSHARGLYLDSSGNTRLSVTDGSGVVSTQLLLIDPSGNMTATGTITSNSDERIKTNWRDVRSDFVDVLATVKAGVYDRTDINATQAGVSAQSVWGLLPEAVTKDGDGIMSVAYGNMALVACVKLAERLIALENKIGKE